MMAFKAKYIEGFVEDYVAKGIMIIEYDSSGSITKFNADYDTINNLKQIDRELEDYYHKNIVNKEK